jgi:hypothetical protein
MGVELGIGVNVGLEVAVAAGDDIVIDDVSPDSEVVPSFSEGSGIIAKITPHINTKTTITKQPNPPLTFVDITIYSNNWCRF